MKRKTTLGVNKTVVTSPKADLPSQESNFSIVGIGASAGGLEAKGNLCDEANNL